MRAAARAGAAVPLLLLLAACGSGSGNPAPPDPTSGAPTTGAAAAAADPGPPCEGDKAAEGLHVLSHADAPLPGGGTVRYDAAHADGTHRTADLLVGTARQTVKAAQQVTLAGHAYTVAQVCTYRVVLTGPGLRAPSNEGESMAQWPTTYDGVLPLRWHVPNNDSRGNSVVVSDIQTDPMRCTISVGDSGHPGAWYPDARQGDTLEFAGRLWTISRIDAGTMDVAADSSDFKPGTVELRELGSA